MTRTFELVHTGSGDMTVAQQKSSLVSLFGRLVSRVLLVLVFSTAVISTTETSFAQSSPTKAGAQNSCDNANSGMYDQMVTNGSVVDSFNIVGAVGFIYTLTLLGAIIDSNAGIGATDNIFDGETSGSATYTFSALIATVLYLDIFASGGTGRIRVRCTEPGTTTPTNTRDSVIRTQGALGVFALTNNLFNPLLTMNHTVGLLMGQSAEQARLLGLVRKYIFFADIYGDLKEDIAAARRVNSFRPGSVSSAELASMETELALLDEKLDAMEAVFDLAGITDDMIDEIDDIYPQRSLPEVTSRDFGVDAILTYYSPNPLSQSTGPLAAFNSFGNGGSLNTTLVQATNYSLWSEVGVVHQLGNGNNGQNGFVAGVKLGGAFRINDRLAIGADVLGTTGRFGITGHNLTGDFSSYGLSITPVLRITDELFFSVSGRYEHFTIAQNQGGVTGNYFAEKFGVTARLAGAYWYEFFLLEPDASVSYDMIQLHQTTLSNNVNLQGVAGHTLKLSLGGRLSASTIPIWGLPSVTPYVSAHGNWLASSLGGGNFDGPTVDLGAGVTIPLGDTGSLGLGVGLNNLFLPAGSNVSANASLNGQF